MAAAYATLAAYGGMMVISYIYGQKYYKVPYDLKRLALYLGVSVLFGGLSFYVFRENYLLSSILLLLFGSLVFVLEGKELKRLLIRNN